MCPLCITTALLSAAGATSGAGALGLVGGKWRTLQQWSCGSLPKFWARGQGRRDKAARDIVRWQRR